MPNTNNKRKAEELVGDDDDLLAKISRLEQENDELKEEINTLKEKNTTLQAKVDEMEDESEDEDDGDDEDSVCDGSPFSKKYFMLKQYKQENGDCRVPQSDKQLGQWVNNMRRAFKNKKLAQERIDKLNKIGFYWGKGYPEPATWDDRFEDLKKYYSTFHHCNIHVDADPEKRSELAKWVLEQRKQGKRLQKQMPSSMTMEQYKLLEGLNFKWKAPKSRRS